MIVLESRPSRWTAAVLLVAGSACAVDDARLPAEAAPSAQQAAEVVNDATCGASASAFAAIQARIFEGASCTAAACHGTAAVGGLDLTGGTAYGALVGAPASNSALPRVAPGDPDGSYLYQKLKAATQPGSVAVAGSPMPVGAPPLTAQQLEAVRLWIAAGAPQSGPVGNVAKQLGACDAAAPTDAPRSVESLLPPPPDEGLQLRMPPQMIKADSEWEGCFASYYDVSAIVPPEFKTPDGDSFYVKGTEILQDVGSHHMNVMHAGLGKDRLSEPAFGSWSCRGGERAGASCDPADLAACGEDGLCASTSRATVACIGYGPPGSTANPASFGIGTTLQSHLVVKPIDGVYRTLPVRGIIYWGLHAFNLTSADREQRARVNLLFAGDRKYEERHESVPGMGHIGIAPFTKKDVCSKWTAPENSRLIRLSSHTHRHGQHFRVMDPQGKQIYESFAYSDPLWLVLDPPLEFTSPAPADRTLTFCSVFNNGVKPDGTPDVELVTRRSRIPSYAFFKCTPVACTAGKVGASCRANADCDSTPGRGDGMCDACPIVGGETTEHEMFYMLPQTVMMSPAATP